MASRDTVVPHQSAWGLGPYGELVHVSQAGRGRTGLVCPGCRAPLVARQGRVQAWHFAHIATDMVRCSSETILHNAAKQLVVQAAEAGLCLQTPSMLEHAHGRDLMGRPMSVGRGAGGGLQAMTGGMNEQPIGDGLLIADAVVDCAGVGTLAIEICVTHAKTPDDEALFATLGQPALEIDLSTFRDRWEITREELLAIVLEKAPRRWIWSPAMVRLRGEAQTQLAGELARRNEALLADAQRYLPTEASLLGLPPIIFACKAAAGDLVATVHGYHSLRSVDGPWERIERGWRRPATADDGHRVECRFGYPGVGDEPAGMPMLELHFGGRSGIAVKGWRETEPTWPLAAQTQARLAGMQARQAMEEQIAGNLPHADPERLEHLCRALGLAPPADPGAASAVPGVAEATLRTGAWVYLVIHRGHPITRQGLGSWLSRLLPGPVRERNLPRERHWISAWLQELMAVGLLQEQARGTFDVTLPENFPTLKPWVKHLGLAPDRTADANLSPRAQATFHGLDRPLPAYAEEIIIAGPDADGERRPLSDWTTSETTLEWDRLEADWTDEE